MRKNIVHISYDISGLLREFKHRSLDGSITCTETGRALGDREARTHLQELLDQGHKLIPLGDCPTFDPQTGCNCRKVSDEEWLRLMQVRGAE